MKKLIQITGIIAILILINTKLTYCQKNPHMGNYEFETECIGVEMDGSVTLITWGNGRNRFDAVDQARKNAVRDVLFKSITKGDITIAKQPLVPEVNAQRKYEDYFNSFFSDKNGEYKNFLSAKDERIDRQIFKKRLKSNEGVSYKVTIRVLRSDLKKKLIEDGIITQ